MSEDRLNLSGHLDGGITFEGTPRYDRDLPGWIRELAEEQYAQLVEYATQHETGRTTA